MAIKRQENPFFLNDYLTHLSVVKGLSVQTVEGYYRDIRQFLRYITLSYAEQEITQNSIAETGISTMTIEEIRVITLRDIYDYYNFVTNECGNNSKIRSRKASSLRSFFRFLHVQACLIEEDPTANLELASPKKPLPKYMNLDEARNMLESSSESDGRFRERDYCILTLFLNCGLRLSELVGLNLNSIDFTEERMRVLGKGSKERMVYLNEACLSALREYCFSRTTMEADTKALFLSSRKKRISKRRVQQIVEHALLEAGLDGRGLSTHKLRHTAATLLYQHGSVDVLTLKEILGHESISTTEIYTHLSDTALQDAMAQSPLRKEKRRHTEN